MKQLILFFTLCLCACLLYGQNESAKKKSVFFELAGSGGVGSLNFEKNFYRVKNTELTWRAGFSLAPIDKNNGTGIVFPLMANALIGKTPHKLECGLGQGITITTKGNYFALTTATLGYRYQSEDKNWFYRVTFTPLISYLVDFQIQPWGGFSIGYSFHKKTK